MNFKSIAELNQDIVNWIERLPNDIDLIVGIPRSGLLAANLLGLHKNLPIGTVEGLLEEKVLASGPRLEKRARLNLSQPCNVLVIDDSVDSGSQILSVKKALSVLEQKHRIRYSAVYATNRGKLEVDYFAQILNQPRFFEWNLFHHGWLSLACMDIDGILCRDPAEEENDDGEKYMKFLLEATPRILPTKEIGWLVTCRLEKYREPTEKWLQRHGVKYKNLIMMNYATKEERLASGNHAGFKAKIYNESEAILFVESSLTQAREIVRLTSKPVWCGEIAK